MIPQPIETYQKQSGVERILVFGELSLVPDDDYNPHREWYGAWWSGYHFLHDGEGFIVSITHWLPLPPPPGCQANEPQEIRDLNDPNRPGLI